LKFLVVSKLRQGFLNVKHIYGFFYNAGGEVVSFY
jgi:hypothetical protein